MESVAPTVARKHMSMLRRELLAAQLWPLLRKLIGHANNRGFFNEPVDWRPKVGLNLPDYPKVITKPMDFSMIKSRLLNLVYSSERMFAQVSKF
jgi:hypothetical protein